MDLRATYRLQLTPELDFAAARALVPYLRRLGVSHLYLSPTLQARSGSTHGYDVVDPTRVSEALGGEAALRALAAEMPLILDIVPNHMGTGEENRWWPDRKVFDFEEGSDFYRRFFDIDDLAAVRQEDPDVFELTHRKTLELLRDGVADGVRVDHPDGLADPAGYLERLRAAGAPGIWVEKILHPGEPLRDWPVDGTVGYEFLNDAQAAFVDPAAEDALTRVWTELTGDDRDFEAVALEAQLQQATTTFAREVAWLHRLAPRFDEATIAHALAKLPVYRTYITPDLVTDEDRRAVAALPEALREVLLAGEGEFVTRFQQTSPPVTAKGTEDTAFYRYLRLTALNEVGGDPSRFGISVEELHALNAARPPRGLLVSTTHDTKRSADVRARIGALTEPELRGDWVALARRWVPEAPDPVSGFLVLQTLLGAHPVEPVERLDGYLEKALREAKLQTNWVEPDEAYEASVQEWARGLLADETFRVEFDALVVRVADAGRRAALGQLALKLTVPGVPDVYGGDELEYRSLVDPDNRRPVDFAARDKALAGPPPKLKLIRDTLALRARRPAAFAGAYEPVAAPEGVCAFVRGGEVLVVVPVRDGVAGTVTAPGFAEVPAGRLGIHESRE
ncbi:MAG: (1-_4)-alpha-D-glucan 1-alpha-D-glucosylmutase [Solirubrobacteraceae bacterium]|nr:(1->4)-alpha-D-glucan 1-alpha-D-glucosylmutase [Solirubrobacteraceae bacterium]